MLFQQDRIFRTAEGTTVAIGCFYLCPKKDTAVVKSVVCTATNQDSLHLVLYESDRNH